MTFVKLKYFHFFLFFILILFLPISTVQEHRLEKYRQQTAAEVALLARKTSNAVNTEHLKCLANNIYWEAASEPFMGQIAVARVVVNRVKHGFASNPCKVVYQSTYISDQNEESGVKKICQFSWVCEGKSTPPRNDRYLLAEDIARKVLTENKWNDVIPGNVLFFHNLSVQPNWSYKKVLTIGNHIFYGKNTNTK